MEWDRRIESLLKWGNSIKIRDWQPYFKKIELSNPWFTAESIERALRGLLRYLDPAHLHSWQEQYRQQPSSPVTVGIIMAGNIPLVGIHDLICGYLSGHQLLIRPSSQDQLLLKLLLDELFQIDFQANSRIRLVSQLKASELNAIITTGSDNTTRYFEYHFQHLPAIMRRNRTSLAILNGDESSQQLGKLGEDIYSYFGRGCRNVSKLMVPDEYDFDRLIDCHDQYHRLLNHSKYSNNYRYQKAFHKLQNLPHQDTGYSLLTKSQSIVSPLSVVYYQYYNNLDQLQEIIAANLDKIQCIAANEQWYDKSYAFGTLQLPQLWDYADGLDTMAFLSDL